MKLEETSSIFQFILFFFLIFLQFIMPVFEEVIVMFIVMLFVMFMVIFIAMFIKMFIVIVWTMSISYIYVIQNRVQNSVRHLIWSLVEGANYLKNSAS